jgi:hypothetical protein
MSDEKQKIIHATEETVCLWYCKSCFHSGALILNGANVYGVIEAMDAGHRARKPDCNAIAGTLRITRPEGWYADTMIEAREARFKA